MNRRTTLLSAAIAASLLSAAAANAAEFRTAEQPLEGRYIVVLKDDAASRASNGLIRPLPASDMAVRMAASHRFEVERSYDNALRGFAVKADDAALARLLADPRVAYVEEDGIVTIDATQNNATWGLDRVDQRNLPLNTRYVYNRTASNVHVYVIDTGVRTTHSQFTGRIGNGATAISDGRGVQECNGHGTHVAGTIGGSTWGVAKGVKIHPVRVLGCTGSGSTSGVIAGMDWVATNRVRPAVANMSLGGGKSTAMNDAVQRMINRGVTVVVAAGNSNADACGFSPASAPAAITVGSTDNNDRRSSFSNFGSCLDVFAPGRNITSAWYTSNTASATISGTSMAAPHVAGAAALYLSVNTGASPGAVRNAIFNNATTGKVTSRGSGSPNRLLYTRNF